MQTTRRRAYSTVQTVKVMIRETSDTIWRLYDINFPHYSLLFKEK